MILWLSSWVFTLFRLVIATLIRANLGTSPWAMMGVALSQISGLTPGTLSVIIGLVVLIMSLVLQERTGWETLDNMLFIGPFEDLGLYLVPPSTNNILLQTSMPLASTLMIGLASAI